MKYQIDGFLLDVQARTLTYKEDCQNVRPKTLSLLLYLAKRQGKVISKHELLENVWDDVSVDEGVIFQSVREIRKLFGNNLIVQNHPRKGYEFTSSFTAVAEPVQSDSEQALSQPTKLLRFNIKTAVIALVVLVFALNIVYFSSSEVSTPIEQKSVRYQQNILVLPIKNTIPYGDNEWIYLGGMEHLIAKLKGLPEEVYVHLGTHIPRLMNEAGLMRNYDSSNVSKLFDTSGASLVVETVIHGNVSDFKLIYKLHVSNDVKQGVLLDSSVKGVLDKLSEKIAQFINHPLQRIQDAPTKEFSDALFAEAMISYENDWKTSISFFESYLALNPNSVIASIYLGKLYLWDQQFERTKVLISNIRQTLYADDYSSSTIKEDKAQLYLLEARLAALKHDWQKAHVNYQHALSELSQHSDWYLKAQIAEAQGLTYFEQKHTDRAIDSLTQANGYYQIIQSPIGVNSTQLHLANAYMANGEKEKAKVLFSATKEAIETIQLEFLYSMLAKYSDKMIF